MNKVEEWEIIEVSESVPWEDDEGDWHDDKETLVSICPINGDWQTESETFAMPLNEKSFWERQIGKTFEMNDRIHKGFDKDGNPILYLKALRKALRNHKEKVEFT
jgi:hypothetical protein